MMTRARFFLDTEFIESQWQLHPVSIGLVHESGRSYSAVVDDFPAELADAWVQKHVLAKLPPKSEWKSRPSIARELRAFVEDFGPYGQFHAPEFWGYFADYDWVLFCWLLGGRMIDMPKGWPMYCKDLKQEMARLRIEKSDLPPQDEASAHDALADAEWNRQVFLKVLEPRGA